MLISKENILAKTHYGIKIYAFLLKQIFPSSTIKLKGRTCELTHSPFNFGKLTLQIRIENGCACHRDIETGTTGDAFDFANRYFKQATNNELYYMINQELNLGLQTPVENQLSFLEEKEKSPEFSFFKAPIKNVIPNDVVNLNRIYSLIKGNSLRQLTTNYRKLSLPKAKRAFKSKYFSYVCFSGVFRKRSDKELLQHSGLLCLDFDHLEELSLTKRMLLNDPWMHTQLLFTSPSGDGLKWIISIDLDLASHRDYFSSVTNYLKKTYYLEPDPSGKDISRACFLCHDPNAYLNPNHKTS